uniref:Uncharacterized protein n=1 Tax=Ditylum brightwellii TaxID=49249 RepID=A0A7S1Z270_9STRA|mmetsp:Transcript_22556/g.33563  ORF Transcript_22556/g.33563 Transcript_22556/m.33563 type:complete len:110 (+) Transcript_22556:195-524(+)
MCAFYMMRIQSTNQTKLMSHVYMNNMAKNTYLKGMKEEFEIEDRFEHIEFKLNLIQQNAKFFLEVLHAQKTNSLEWIIIVLISFECSLMCLEMSGLGGTFFQAILPYST